MMSLKVGEQDNKSGQNSHSSSLNTSPCGNYEKIIRKLESDQRKYIRLQNQYKLHIGKLESENKELLIKFGTVSTNCTSLKNKQNNKKTCVTKI